MPFWKPTVGVVHRIWKHMPVLVILCIAASAPAWSAIGSDAPAGGAVIEVDDSLVAVAEDGLCSLIEAFENAVDAAATHADCAAGSPDGTTITLSPDSTYQLEAIHNSDAGPTGLPSVTAQITLVGNGAIIERLPSSPPHRLLHVADSGELAISDLTLRQGLVVDPLQAGAGIHNLGILSISQVVLENHSIQGLGGGALFNGDGASLTVEDSTLRNNGGAGPGAGLFNAEGGTVSVSRSTVNTNTCGAPGCGIRNEGLLAVENSTFSGNSGPMANGLDNSGTATLTHVTLANLNGGEPFAMLNSGELTLTNTLLAGTLDNVNACAGAPPTFAGNNLVEDGSCGCTDEPSCLVEEPALGALGDNGGPTETHALPAGSIAIGQAAADVCTDTDQRGVERPQGDACDLGAYESELVLPELLFDPSSLDFGEVETGGTSAAGVATLHNHGGDATELSFSDPSAAGFEVDATDCGAALAAGDSCEVSVTFTPAEPGAAALDLVVDSAQGVGANLGLSGVGVEPPPATITVDPEFLEAVLTEGDSEGRSLTIANPGQGQALEWEVTETNLVLPGEVPQFSGNVLALQVWDDGSGPAPYAAGAFGQIDGVQVSGIARWDGQGWQALGTGVSGVTTINALTVYEGDLIAGGNFTTAGGEPAFRVARWDGEVWSPVGTGSLTEGMNQAVNAVVVYEGDLIAAGAFTNAGGQTVNRIARWNGTEWLPLGTGMNQTVHALAVYDGDLIAAGSFVEAGGQLANRIARWDGSQWSSLGTGMDGLVMDLAVFDGELIAAGGFDLAGGQTVNRIARWDGNQWAALGDGVEATVRTLAVFDGGLIIGGRFGAAGDVTINNVARWDGNEWSALGAGIHLAPFGLTVEAFTEWGGQLVAGGNFSEVGDGHAASNVAVWDGDAWLPLWVGGETIECGLPGWVSVQPPEGTVPGDGEQVIDITFDADDQAPGEFETNLCIESNDPEQPLTLVPLSLTVEAGEPGPAQLVFHESALNFDEVEVGGSATLSTVLENIGGSDADTVNLGGSGLAVYDVDGDDCSGGLPVGESCEIHITYVPVQAGANLATLMVSGPGFDNISLPLSGFGVIHGAPELEVDPGSFDAELRQGQLETRTLNLANQGDAPVAWHIPADYSEFDRPIDAMVVWDDGNGPALYAGGNSLSGVFNGIARWDGESWLPLGTGLGHAGAQTVNALTVFDGELIAAGTFRDAGGITVNRIARWDGSRWLGLGSGMNGTVNALAVHDGYLVAGGQFTEAGGVAANRIARWDGHEWSPLSSGTNNSITALTVYDGDLIAGGNFTGAGGVAVNRVAAWDGNQWSPLGDGIGASLVQSLGEYDGALIVAGNFSEAGGVAVNRIARWDGSQWSPLGDGITAGLFIEDLIEFDGALIVSGWLSEAGGVPVNSIARWDGSQWSPLGDGLFLVGSGTANGRALAVLDDALLVGGRFTHAGGMPALHIARWDGEEWAPQVAEPAACHIPHWLSVSPVEGVLAAGDATQVAVTFDTRELEVGDFSTQLCVVNDDAGAGLITIPVTLTVTEPPVADITPDAFAFEVTQGGNAAEVLNIGNLGPVDLEWHIGAADPDIVVFDNVNFTVPATSTGGSVRWVTGETCDCDDAPFNFNIWRTNTEGALSFFWPAGGIPANAGGVADENNWYDVLTLGDTIGPQSAFIDFISVTEAGNWRQAGGVDGYFGFRFFNDNTETVNYGYARITTTGTGGHPATIVGWAYNRTGNPIVVRPLSAEGCDDPADIPWLDVDPVSGVTPPESSLPVDITVTAGTLEAGTYEARLCASTNDPTALLVEIPVTLDVIAGDQPQIDIDPASLSATLEAGDTEAQLLTIGNLGAGTLTWQVTEEVETAGGSSTAAVRSSAGILGTAFETGGVVSGAQPFQPAGGLVDCDAEPGIIIHDHGTVDAAYGANPGDVNEITWVDRFTPDAYPATFSALCVVFSTDGPTVLDFDIVVYDDDGPDNGPGTELGVLPATADGIQGSGGAPVWFSFDLSPLELAITSGSVYIGVRYAPSAPNVFIAADESPDNPVGFAGGHVMVDIEPGWIPIELVAVNYRALLIRAVAAPAGEPLDCTLPDWIDVSPDNGSIVAGGDQFVDVTLDAGGLLPGHYEANLCIASNDPNNGLVVVPVVLTVDESSALPGELDVSPVQVTFGEVGIGASASAMVTVTHVAEPGAVDMLLSRIDLTGDPTFAVVGGDCAENTVLVPQQSCTLEIAFTPTAAGTVSGELQVESSDGQSDTVVLSGHGVDDSSDDLIFGDRFEQGGD